MSYDGPGIYNMSEREYFADPVPGGSLSHSGAKLLLEAPAKFKHDVLDCSPTPPTDAMMFGSAVHCAVLNPQDRDELVVMDDASHEAMTTFRRDDGQPIGEAERWTTTADYLHLEVFDEPAEFVEERWVRVGVRRFVLQPDEPEQHNPAKCHLPLGSCLPCMAAFRIVGGHTDAPAYSAVGGES